MRRFVTWYNHQHRHSALGLLTPADVHFGRIEAVVAQRQAVLDAAFAAHPERFPRGRPLAQRPPSVVYLNPHLPSQNLPLPAQEVMLLPTLLL
jgi:hypothetical protein